MKWEDRLARAEELRKKGIPQEVFESVGLTDLPKSVQPLLTSGFLRPIVVELPKVKSKPRRAEPGKTQILVLPDIHAPVHDERALDVALVVGHNIGVDEIIILGDAFDVNALSRYVPADLKLYRWVDERNLAVPVIANIRREFPGTKITYIFGNHERRVQKYINSVAPQLEGLFSMPVLLGIDSLGFEFSDGPLLLADGSLMVKHGTKVGKYAVRQEIEVLGMSVVFGHSHRRSTIEVTKASQRISGAPPMLGVEAGCLCSLSPAYYEKEDTANWQHGAALITLYGGNEFDIELIRIFDGRAMFRGHRFHSRI